MPFKPPPQRFDELLGARLEVFTRSADATPEERLAAARFLDAEAGLIESGLLATDSIRWTDEIQDPRLANYLAAIRDITTNPDAARSLVLADQIVAALLSGVLA